MSKAKTPVKVLRTALKRIEKAWTQRAWRTYDPETDQTFVCLEGAVFGYCQQAQTQAQRDAIEYCQKAILDLFPDTDPLKGVPDWNDKPERTKDDVLSVVKLALIKAETDDLIDMYPDDEEVDDLLEDLKGS